MDKDKEFSFFRVMNDPADDEIIVDMFSSNVIPEGKRIRDYVADALGSDDVYTTHASFDIGEFIVLCKGNVEVKPDKSDIGKRALALMTANKKAASVFLDTFWLVPVGTTSFVKIKDEAKDAREQAICKAVADALVFVDGSDDFVFVQEQYVPMPADELSQPKKDISALADDVSKKFLPHIETLSTLSYIMCFFEEEFTGNESAIKAKPKYERDVKKEISREKYLEAFSWLNFASAGLVVLMARLVGASAGVKDTPTNISKLFNAGLSAELLERVGGDERLKKFVTEVGLFRLFYADFECIFEDNEVLAKEKEASSKLLGEYFENMSDVAKTQELVDKLYDIVGGLVVFAEKAKKIFPFPMELLNSQNILPVK